MKSFSSFFKQIMLLFRRFHLVKGMSLAVAMIFMAGVIVPAYGDAPVLSRGNKNQPMMALTFDDGGSVENVRSVLNTLEKHNIHATFFFVGKFIQGNPALMQELVAKGNEMGNHSYNHPDFTKSSRQKILEELNSSALAFKNATGVDMKPYVRPPYGAKNNAVLSAISDAGYTHTVLWNVDTNDWKKLSADTIKNHVLKNAGNGNIVLMHTTKNSHSAEALPEIIQGLQDKGYQLVTISQLLSQQPQSAPVDPEAISQVEFLNNLLYTLNGTYYANAGEIKTEAVTRGIIGPEESVSFYKYLTKDEMLHYINLAYPGKSEQIATAFAPIEMKKSTLSAIISLIETIKGQ